MSRHAGGSATGVPMIDPDDTFVSVEPCEVRAGDVGAREGGAVRSTPTRFAPVRLAAGPTR